MALPVRPRPYIPGARGEPRLVTQARFLAVFERFDSSCKPEVGQLLRVLAASVRDHSVIVATRK